MSFARNLISLSVVLALSFSSQQIFAEDFDDEMEDDLADYYGDEDFVSIATGTKQLIHRAPSMATVITREEIELQGALDIDEVLESVPGLHVSYRPGNHLPIYTFRGVYSVFNPQVLMLINGVPITNIFVGNRNQLWGGMSLNSVSRIEVIRGPGSAIYGADASAGVINIVTLSGESKKGTNLGLRTGSFDTTDFWVTYAWSEESMTGFVSYEKHKTDGFEQFIESDQQTFLDGVFSTNASLAPGYADHYRDNDELRFSLKNDNFVFNAGYQKRIIGVGLGVVDVLEDGSVESSKRWNFDFSYSSKEIIEDWELSAKFSYFDTSQEVDTFLMIFPPGADIGFGAPFPDGVIGNPEVFERHYRTGVVLRNLTLNEHKITFGLGHDISDLYKVQESKNFAFGPNGEFLTPGSPVVDVTDTPYIFLPEDDRSNSYLYVQDVWDIAKDWELTAGLRYDKYSDFGATTNPRLALVWASSQKLTTKFLYGRAFRAPSFAEMRNINNPSVLGNPDLDPETIDTLEVAFSYLPDSHLKSELSFFAYNWQDIINFVPDEGATTSTANNVGEQDGYGMEFEISWSPNNDFDLIANYSWLSAEDSMGVDVHSVPGQQLYLRGAYSINQDWTFALKSNWVMDRKRSFDDLRNSIDDYNSTDMKLAWNLPNSNFKVALIAKNIFNSDAREPTANKGSVVNLPGDLPLPRRAIFLEASMRFN